MAISDLNLNNNILKNVVLERRTAAPTKRVEGNVYFNTTLDKIQICIGEDLGFRTVTNVTMEKLYFDDNKHLIAVLNNGIIIDAGPINTDSAYHCQMVFDNEEGSLTPTKYGSILSCSSLLVNFGLPVTLTDFLVSYPEFCSSSDNYALCINDTGIGENNNIAIISSETVYVSPGSKIVVNYKADAFYSRVIIKFIQAASPDDILSSESVVIAQGSMIAQPTCNGSDYLDTLFYPTAPGGESTFVPGYYYPIMYGLSGTNWMKIGSIKVFNEIPVTV